MLDIHLLGRPEDAVQGSTDGLESVLELLDPAHKGLLVHIPKFGETQLL